MQKLKIIAVKEKPFKGREGNMIPYWWVTARDEKGVVIQFGTKLGIYKPGIEIEVELEKGPNRNGDMFFKEIVREDNPDEE